MYQNQNNSHPLPDEKAMSATIKNDRDDNIADKNPALIMFISKAYRDFTKKVSTTRNLHLNVTNVTFSFYEDTAT